jgi:predicted nucleotidyltransferase
MNTISNHQQQLLHHKQQISQVLKQLEKELNIVILFAADAGSRSYGWSSHGSDFDVHMIYARHSSYYLTIQNNPDNFGEMTRMMKIQKKYLDKKFRDSEEECEIECNVTGYELRNFLTLFGRSNPAMVHTVQTPIVYYQFIENNFDFGAIITELCHRDVSRRVMVQSLLNLAKTNVNRYILGKDAGPNSQVRLKIYLYLIHHLLYIQYIQNNCKSGQDMQTLPPLELRELLADAQLKAPLRRIVFHLLSLKTNNHSGQDILVPRYIYLEVYLLTLWKVLYKWAFTLDRHFMTLDPLDKILRQTLKHTDPLCQDIDIFCKQ